MRKLLIFCSLVAILFSCVNQTKVEEETQNDSIAGLNESVEVNNFLNNKSNLTYDISIKELMEINIIDSTNIEYEPSYELSIKDLMEMKIVKELRLDTSLGVSYDIPLNDLMTIEIPLQKKNRKDIKPNYEMSLQGLLEWQIEEEYKVVDRVELTYDISLDGLMEIKIKGLNRKDSTKRDSLLKIDTLAGQNETVNN